MEAHLLRWRRLQSGDGRNHRCAWLSLMTGDGVQGSGVIRQPKAEEIRDGLSEHAVA